MKNFYKVCLCALSIAFMACVDKYTETVPMPDKPAEVAANEYMNSFDVLKSYSNGKLATAITPADFLAKGLPYSTVMHNFDGIDVSAAYIPANMLQTVDGSYDFGDIQTLTYEAQTAGVTLYGGALCSKQGQPATYLNKLIAPTVIPFKAEKGQTMLFDFESDAIGTVYPMTSNSSTVVENDPDGKTGKALHVGTEEAKANNSYPKFHVVLPEGRKLGDYVSLVFDMRIVNSDGIYGQGMQCFINGQQFGMGTSPAGMGCAGNVWSRGLVCSMVSNETAPGFVLPKGLAELTEFDLAFGSQSGAAQYFLDNIAMNYETSSSGSTVIDFENDALGVNYPMTNGNQSVVVNDPKGVSGKVLQVGANGSYCSYSYPKFNVKLEDGMTFADYSSITMDMYIIDSHGGWGSGMRVIINGVEINCGTGPFSYGCPNNDWGRGMISIGFLRDGTASGNGKIAIPAAWETLTEFEMAIGSGSGEWYGYIDNISLNWKQDKDKIIEKTPEEKEEILTAELKKWIGGMVSQGGDVITDWDAVSQPLDDFSDANTFDWSEYLGNPQYARTAVKMARDTATATLKLFVSNTFSQYDDLDAQTARLIELVNSWEADGKTVIDGYNIRLQAICAEDESFQTLNKAAITAMLTKLAATKKAIRLSDLSVMVEDKTGNFPSTSTILTVQRELAADYIAFILQQYRQLIEPAYQYGVSIAGMTETTGGTILCPWTSGFKRTEIYEGIVNGLK